MELTLSPTEILEIDVIYFNYFERAGQLPTYKLNNEISSSGV